ncbi:cellulase family glycosylhydrolase [Streptomyces hygroscopicus subsp. hygroscopicus]|uniref:cellulase family glycosylhydrolase n=1 Tax=Streptomyces hygroscopicus TaxID=1912 RepID=UPI000824DDCA|nr:cellulase family glycosylhydrolase [Streptomyces hygroscopicus]MBW8092878.1 cellulase family glycosylhydrolase [Streptomyces hygroscopicus subsp. hygroscopicus]
MPTHETRGIRIGRPRPGRTRLLGAAVLLLAAVWATGTPAAAAEAPWFDGRAADQVTVEGTRFADGHGREVVLRGFNVSGETKLEENGGLPFAGTADARASAAAMRNLTGADAVRFLLSWAHAEPRPGQVDTAYLERATAQLKAFLDAGIRVFPDFHQDLYSRHLFDEDSWYSGDGAPEWVVDAGGYPKESCGICFHWGQNITQNQAVRSATRDFWSNRALTTEAGTVRVQDAFLATAEKTMSYLAQHLTEDEFARVVGFDPLNEPYAGVYDDGHNSRTWEKSVLWPFYEKFRARMDAAGWQDKPAFVEPNMFWNSNLGFQRQEGGFLDAGQPGPDYVFNTHYYDQKAISGIFMPGKAADGQYAADFGALRDRATALNLPAVLSEFGHPLSGFTSDKAPTVVKGMYQALDSRLSGATWWTRPAASGAVLSSTQWQWDLYSGRHHEAMNGDTGNILTEGDAWNGEDLSAVRLDDSGDAALRQDARLLDRLYPRAVAGRTLAFTFEDRSRDGSTTLSWNRVPGSLPNVAELTGSGRYGMLVWRSGGGTDAPTELRLPRDFDPARTTVVSDLGAVTGPPAYTAHGHTADHPIATAADPGATGARRLLLSAPAGEGAGTLHYALIADGTTAPSAELRAAARSELARWAADAGF